MIAGLVHADAIGSPGLTCCVSIAKYLTGILRGIGLSPENKENWNGRSNPPAWDTNGVTRRTRSGMGRCQGGFCGPHVMKLISQELGMASVKTATPVAKGQIMTVMQALWETKIQASIHIGDVILQNVCGSHIIATKEIPS